MKISEAWLREWVDPAINGLDICHGLTMGGLEVEEYAPVAADFSGVVVAKILKIEKHPEADRLNLCEVDAGESKPLKIVCGASNVRVGMHVPAAKIGAVLPKDITIKPTEIRGVQSEGMLCSASELGLSEENQGLMELSEDAKPGEDLRQYLQLDDHTIDISITPNRGDCLSVRGIAREVSALTKTPLKMPVTEKKPVENKSVHARVNQPITTVSASPALTEFDIYVSESPSPSQAEIKTEKPAITETKKPAGMTVTLKDKAGCPHYVGRIIRNVKADLQTPTWLKEKLRRSGARSINPIVDVTNYVMLELGQPMHAFDLNTIRHGILVRKSRAGEKIALLDGSEKELDSETLVIADRQRPLAIAGVMGGLDSSVTTLTKDIFLESAYFSPSTIARQRQFYGLNSDSAYRFERGVDSTIQLEAIERATQLILEIAGGEAEEIIDVTAVKSMPKQYPINISSQKIRHVLGVSIPENEVEAIFSALGFQFKGRQKSWSVTPPTYRNDITLAEDLIEEVARIYGYDNIPTNPIKGDLQVNHRAENSRDLHGLRQAFSDQGYHEIISYSFIDKKIQALLDPAVTPKELLNPITAEMTVMRTNLWPGLVNTLLYNKSRQQNRIRLFEIGACFISNGDELSQHPRLAGLITGLAEPEQWGLKARDVDFYDLKGDLQNILGLSYPIKDLTFKPANHAALHPGQTAAIYYQNQQVGILGALHPAVLQSLDFPAKVFVFELDLNLLQASAARRYQEISKFPEIRRDIAILVNQTIPAKDIQDRIKIVAGDWLKDVFIFDVYLGKGISPGQKSVALALVLQHPTRTLVDDEVTGLIDRVISELKGQLGAELRS